ncbi:hypothetical protein J4457_06345 [Candidatus Woesearchaeota archaeon]|nr:hypothetical protein [Candidatus Woesearchaeota archaeon]
MAKRKSKQSQVNFTVAQMPRRFKRHLTLDQEFEIMKIVLDKFLWLGFAIMAFGLYVCLTATIREGFYYILSGIVILLLFVWIIVKEFEIITK